MVFSQSIPGREIRLGLAGSDLPGSGLPGRACRVRLTVLGLPGSGLPGRVLYPHEQMSGWVCKGVENSGEIFGHIRLLFSLLLIYLSYKCFVFLLVSAYPWDILLSPGRALPVLRHDRQRLWRNGSQASNYTTSIRYQYAVVRDTNTWPTYLCFRPEEEGDEKLTMLQYIHMLT